MIVHQDIYLIAKILTQLVVIAAVSTCFYFYAKLEKVSQRSIHIAIFTYFSVLILDAILTISLFSIQYGTNQLLVNMDTEIFMQNQLMPMMAFAIICTLQIGAIVPSASRHLFRTVLITTIILLILAVSYIMYLLFSQSTFKYTSVSQCVDFSSNNSVAWIMVMCVSYISAFSLFGFYTYILYKNRAHIQAVTSTALLFTQIKYELLYFTLQQIFFLVYYFIARHEQCDLATNMISNCFNVFFEINRGMLFIFPNSLRQWKKLRQEETMLIESSSSTE
ncbi:Hypothetical_protein [Hexamita inflata]|uniref:Hypothetical_protein n=1 Tax=Hexamita inflata TaxID=28002 RepID=A0AA86U010_9EUKA|nr:Hypothetical protein HINF_LOCUS22606 [Hexamita inflata]